MRRPAFLLLGIACSRPSIPYTPPPVSETGPCTGLGIHLVEGRVITWTIEHRDEALRTVLLESFDDGDRSELRSRRAWEYDDEGRLLAELSEPDDDGGARAGRRWERDEEGRVQVQETWGYGYDSTALYNYGADGLLAEVEVEYHSEPPLQTLYTYRWDEDRLVERLAYGWTLHADGPEEGPIEILRRSYLRPAPSMDHLEEEDLGADGDIDHATIRRYDEAGHLLEEIDTLDDEIEQNAWEGDLLVSTLRSDPDQSFISRWHHDPRGLPLERLAEQDLGNDGTIDWTAADRWTWSCP